MTNILNYFYTKTIAIYRRYQDISTRFFMCIEHAKRANIMLLVLFVMFVSSMLGLIVAQYVQHLISVSSIFQDYYRSYYYAYGGLELGLAQTKFHGYGFQDGVDSDFVFNDFTTCAGAVNYACDADITIKSRWNPVADSYQDFADCTALASNGGLNHIDYSLSAGDAIIIPLFWDEATGFDAISYTTDSVIASSEFDDMTPTMYTSSPTTGETYLIKVIDENLENYNKTLEPTTSSIPYVISGIDYAGTDGTNKNYLVIANATGDVKDFCLQLDSGETLVSKYVFIESVGSYNDSVASLSALKVDQLPSFLGYGTINSF